MTSQDVERRLTAVLHRRAEDAMSRTDTPAELRELLSRDDHEPPRIPGRNRRTAVLGAGLAAATVAATVLWGTGPAQDRAEPPPVQEPRGEAVEIADEFVAALDTGDAQRMLAVMATGEKPWLDWRLDLRVFEALSFEYLWEPCQQVRPLETGTEVACPYALHVLRSDELGLGPFGRNLVTVIVDEGRVAYASNSMNYANNGQDEYLEAVIEWVRTHHPEDFALFNGDPWSMTDEADRDRWLRLWDRYGQDYVEAHS